MTVLTIRGHHGKRLSPSGLCLRRNWRTATFFWMLNGARQFRIRRRGDRCAYERELVANGTVERLTGGIHLRDNVARRALYEYRLALGDGLVHMLGTLDAQSTAIAQEHRSILVRL
jgi:hypothetical protein